MCLLCKFYELHKMQIEGMLGTEGNFVLLSAYTSMIHTFRRLLVHMLDLLRQLEANKEFATLNSMFKCTN